MKTLKRFATRVVSYFFWAERVGLLATTPRFTL
jgi:hypothetical protein